MVCVKETTACSHSPVRYFDDVVCELHALKGHGLPFHACAGTIDKSLKHNKQIHIKKSQKMGVNGHFIRHPSGRSPCFGRWHQRWRPACRYGVRRRCRRRGRSQRSVWTPEDTREKRIRKLHILRMTSHEQLQHAAMSVTNTGGLTSLVWNIRAETQQTISCLFMGQASSWV